MPAVGLEKLTPVPVQVVTTFGDLVPPLGPVGCGFTVHVANVVYEEEVQPAPAVQFALRPCMVITSPDTAPLPTPVVNVYAP